MSGVSRDLMRAILEARDHRHNETHAALLLLWQALVAELVESGALLPADLSARLEQAAARMTGDVHAEAARDLLVHTIRWLGALDPKLPAALPDRWRAPRLPVGEASEE